MSEPTCANCPKGVHIVNPPGMIECRAHPPTVVRSYYDDTAQETDWPLMPPGEYCHEHPALEAQARVLVIRDEFFAGLEGVSVDEDGWVVFEDAEAARRFAARRKSFMDGAYGVADVPAQQQHQGPRDMCELEEGGRDG